MVQQGAGSVDPSSQTFARGDARAVYRAILERRDMRHFAGGQSVAQFYAGPLWAEAGWARRQPLEMPVFDNAWGRASSLFPGESTR